jgi:hypothetical protein
MIPAPAYTVNSIAVTVGALYFPCMIHNIRQEER